MSIAIRDFFEYLTNARLPTHYSVTPDLAALNPFFADSGFLDPQTGLKVIGNPVGFCGRENSGGIMPFNEFMLHETLDANEKPLVNDRNTKVLGLINHRKSTGEKTDVVRTAAHGFNNLVIDPKDHEYTPTANWLNQQKEGSARVLQFGRNARYFINLVEPTLDDETKMELLTAVAVTTIDDEKRPRLNVREKSVLWEALKETNEHFAVGDNGLRKDDPTLKTLLEKLKNPTPTMAEKLAMDMTTLNEVRLDLYLGLRRLDEDGDLAGMFHQKTTPGIFKPMPLLVLDCDGVSGERAVIMITLINFFTLSRNARSQSDDNRFHYARHDESWGLATYPGYVDSLRYGFKLGRTYGFANRIVAHHLSNLQRSGNYRAIEDLISDSSITILYRQDAHEIEQSAEALGLTAAEVARIKLLPPGHAIYKVRGFPGIEVEQIVFDFERVLVDTSRKKHGRTDLKRAKPIEQEYEDQGLLEEAA